VHVALDNTITTYIMNIYIKLHCNISSILYQISMTCSVP